MIKATKVTIPALLTITVLVAGIFAFMPVDEVSTVHTTILAATTGIACATEAVDMGAEIDDDTILFTFDQPIILFSMEFNGDANLLGDDLGFDAITIDGANAIANLGVFEEVLDDTPDLNWIEEGPWQTSNVYVGATITMTADDNGAEDVDANDDFTVTFCGLVENAGNFDGDDVLAAITEG